MAVQGTLQQVQGWSSGYLGYIGAPKSQGNIEGLSAQVYQEGNYGTAYGGGSTNPLNIEGAGPGGFLRPASTQAGYAATESFMAQNDPGMLAALRGNKGTSPQPYINALSAGQWEALNSGPKAYLNRQYGADVASTLSQIYRGKYQAPTSTGTSGSAAAKKPSTTTTPGRSLWQRITVGTSPGAEKPSTSSGLFGLSWTWVLVIVGVGLLIWGMKGAAGKAVEVAPEVAAA